MNKQIKVLVIILSLFLIHGLKSQPGIPDGSVVPWQQNYKVNRLNVKIFPNPATDFSFLEYELQQAEYVGIQLVSPLGQPLNSVSKQKCAAGKHRIKVELTKYPPGIYIVSVHAGGSFSTGKISIFR